MNIAEFLLPGMNKRAGLLLLLVAYLPFQAALNLASDIDLLSGRVLILGLFGAWAVKELYQKKSGCHPGLPPRPTSVRVEAGDPACLAGRQGSRPSPQLRGASAGMTEAWALVLFFILSVISIFGADNQIWGLRKLLVFASIFPLYFLVQALLKKEEHRKKLIYVIIGGAAVSAGIALAQFGAQFIFGQERVMIFWAVKIVPIFSGASFGNLVASNPSWLVDIGGQTVMRAIGLFPDPHMLAFYLGLTLPFTLSALFFEKKYRLPLFLVSSFLFLVLLLTFSRGGYLGMLAAGAIFGVLGWRRFNGPVKKFLAVGILSVAAIFLLVGWPITMRLASSFDLSEGSNIGRLAIWQDSWGVIKKNPIIGVGLGNYSSAIDFSGGYRSAVTSHNLYLDIWAETGLLGLAAWLAILGLAVCSAWKKIKSAPVAALGALSGLAYFSVHSFFETAIFNPTVLAFLMIVLGLATVNYEK